jgi:hypothetical protein
MFELMHFATVQKGLTLYPYENTIEKDILPLGKQRQDTFMDVFSSDFVKILKAIDQKKARLGDDVVTPKVGGLK